MSTGMLAALNAAASNGRSLASQRGEVAASGRITPALPLPFPEPPEFDPESLPQAATRSVITTRPAPAPSKRLSMACSFLGAGPRQGGDSEGVVPGMGRRRTGPIPSRIVVDDNI